MPATCTPLRYPGGKSCLYPLASGIIKGSNLSEVTYAEPFAGGAGLALKLLMRGEVETVVLNDYDPAIASFWLAAVSRADALIEFVLNVEVSLEEWVKQRNVYEVLRGKALARCSDARSVGCRPRSPLAFLSEDEALQLACASFFLNRTNRSGIMAGGPIGGKAQEGRCKIDARFSKEGLAKKIEAVASFSGSISVHNLDAADFIQHVIPGLAGSTGSDLLVYFDPPYVAKGPGLYRSSLTEDGHRNLSKLIRRCRAGWFVTYDDCDFVRRLYSGFRMAGIDMGYSAYKASKGRELLVLSDGLALPAT